MDTNNIFSDDEKEHIERELKKVKVRRYWPRGFSPVTRVVPDKKKYKRTKLKLKDIREDYGL